MIGKMAVDTMPADDIKRMQEIFDNILASKVGLKDVENWHLTKDGRRKCFLTSSILVLIRKASSLDPAG